MHRILSLVLAGLVLAGMLASPAPGQSKKAADLIKALATDKNPKARIAAAEEIADLAVVKLSDAQSALPALLAAQKDTDPGVRKAALNAIGRIDPQGYPGVLLDVLKKDKDPTVRIAVVALLTQLLPPPKETVPALHDLLKAMLAEAQKEKLPLPSNPPKDSDIGGVRKAIIAALVRVRPEAKDLGPILLDVLKKDREPTVRVAAATALGQLGAKAKDFGSPLHDVLKTYILEAQKDKTPLPASAPGTLPDTDSGGARKAIIAALVLIYAEPKERLPVLLDVLKRDREPTVRAVVITALGQIGPDAKEALGPLHDAVKTSLAEAPKLPATVKDTDVGGVRKAALTAFGQIMAEPKERVSLLLDVLKKDREPSVRLIAIAALGQLGAAAKASVPVLTDIQKASLAQRADVDLLGVRKAVLEALLKIEPEPRDHLARLLDTLKKDRDPAVSLVAVTGLGQHGPQARAAAPSLKDVQRNAIILSPDSDAQGLRKAVLDVLPKIDADPNDHVLILLDTLKGDRDPVIRILAVGALGQLGAQAKAAVGALTEILKVGKVSINDREKELAKEAEAALLKIQVK